MEFIIPKTTPIVIPEVAPTSIPFFHPNIKTNIILNIFVIERSNTFIPLKADTAIDSSKLAPITSSIENTFLSFKPTITFTELENIL